MQIHFAHVEVRERYDPIFILQFSIHGLSKAYIEPVEFAGSGLLAIAFVSMSSPDHGIRRLAYGTLDKFKNALEVGNVFISLCFLLPYHVSTYKI
jgi:nucleolar pre-ribosomal-associated protein 1